VVSTPALEGALQLKRSGDLEAAVIALEAVLGERPSDPLALAHLADTQIKRGRLEEATAALDRAEAGAGATAFTSHLRGDLHYKAGRWAEAARSYQDAVALGDRGTWSLVQLARCHLRLGDLDGAQGAASQAVERDSKSSSSWVTLGDVAWRASRLEEAEARYQRAHELAPADQWAYAKLMEARLMKLPPEKRDREIEVLLKTTGRGNKHLVGVLARLRSQQGDPDAAAQAWGRQAQVGDLFARKQQGFALRKAGRLDEAAAVLGPCLLADPEDRYVFSSYVSLQTKRGVFEELRATLEEALPRAGSRRGAYYGALRKLPPPPT
jgi:tetratricopeptide (TPR) repeat protein